MDWAAPLATLVGAVVGVGSTLVVDRARWRRDRASRSGEVRRAVYVSYLTALQQARGAIREISLGEHSPETSLKSATHAAFRASEVYQAREQVALTAPEGVVLVADEAFRLLRELRDQVARGHDLKSPGYQTVLTSYGQSLDALRDEMRKDLGAQPLRTGLPL